METRKGRQSPTVSVILPYTETRGEEAVQLYDRTEHSVIPWQVSSLYDIMAIDDEGLWVHQKIGYAVARRNGKSESVLMRCLWGLENGERILYTAHRATTAHAVWERLGRMCDKVGLEIESNIKAFGKEHIYVKDGGVIEFRTRTSTGALGEGYDLLIIDEAQEYTPEQETALKYVVTDSENPQTIMLGTPPTAISAGTVFPKFRERVLRGDSYASGWFEWSVDKITDPNDVDAWYETNPSLGYFLKERTIRSEIGDDEVDFNIQRLGHWLKYNQRSAISRNEWDALRVDKLPELKSKLYCGVKFGKDGINTSLSIAAKTDKGVFIETIDCRPSRTGVAWLVDFITKSDVASVAIDGANGATILVDALKQTGFKKASIVKTGEFVTANALFEQAIATGSVFHMEQPAVDQIINHCDKRTIGSNGGFGYQSQLNGADISILDSIILAHYHANESKAEHKQTVSY